MTTRKIRRLTNSVPTLEGAGVHLHRAFSREEAELFDPFLLLDDFRSATPEHYLKGFPWHPHRGIETITYVLEGDVEHGDSLGNQGDITSGDVQWMTAGNGIIHQEMPKGSKEGRMEGFQLWANLPASDKMMAPRYRDIATAQIPILRLDNGTEIKIICGRLGGLSGPVTDVMIEPEYLDVSMPANAIFTHPVQYDHTVFVYIFEGSGRFDETANQEAGNRSLVLFDQGDQVVVTAGKAGVRFILVSGKPLREPIAWGGPIVMNTREELEQAFADLRDGTFVKHGS